MTDFLTAKETRNKMKRQPTKWGEIFANNVTDQGLISKIYKQLIQLNNKKANNTTEKWAEDLDKHFSKKTYRWPVGTWKSAQHGQQLREIQIKIIMRYHLTPVSNH